MKLSIVTRSLKTSELKHFLEEIRPLNDEETEVIAVCRVKDCDLENINLIIEDTNRFEARITGIRKARYENILLLDSDQVPDESLLPELKVLDVDMGIIPERSLSSSLIAPFLDDYRKRIEKFAYKCTLPNVPVVPRFYKRELLLKVIKSLPEDIYRCLSHEDSILYYEAFKYSQNVKFCNNYIYNTDSDFATLMKKALLYGKYKKDTDKNLLSREYISLLRKLNLNSLNVREIGLGKGFLIQSIRAIAYFIGSII